MRDVVELECSNCGYQLQVTYKDGYKPWIECRECGEILIKPDGIEA